MYLDKDIWYYVLVIDILKYILIDVSCIVVYCKLCVFLFGRMIKKEDVVIIFKKLFNKLDFELFGFKIYELDVVVKNVNVENIR